MDIRGPERVMIWSDAELAQTMPWAANQETSMGFTAEGINDDLVERCVDEMQVRIGRVTVNGNRVVSTQIGQAADDLLTLQDHDLGFLTARDRQRAAP